MTEHLVALISAICQENGRNGRTVSVNHGNEGSTFVVLPIRLENAVSIDAVKCIIESILNGIGQIPTFMI